MPVTAFAQPLHTACGWTSALGSMLTKGKLQYAFQGRGRPMRAEDTHLHAMLGCDLTSPHNDLHRRACFEKFGALRGPCNLRRMLASSGVGHYLLGA